MRKEEVFEFLGFVNSLLPDIQKKYDEAKTDVKIKSLYKPIVTSSLEHLRRVLDYLTKDIFDFVYTEFTEEEKIKKYKTIHFPYGQTENDFRSMIGKSLPNLDTRKPELYNLLLDLQPFKSELSYIYDLCVITNTQKHDNAGQSRRDDRYVLIKEDGIAHEAKGFGFVTPTITIKNSHHIQIDHVNITERIIILNSSHIRVTKCKIGNTYINDEIFITSTNDYIDEKFGSLSIQQFDDLVFRFANSETSVLDLIQESLDTIQIFAENLYRVIV